MARELIVGLALIACASMPLPSLGAANLRPPASEQDEPAVPIPGTSAGRQLRWVLRTLNGEEPGDVASHFTDHYLEDTATAEEVITELGAIRSEVFKDKKVRAILVNEGDRDDTLTAVIRGASLRRYLSVFIIVDDKSGKIAGLQFKPAGGDGGGETPTESGGTWDEMDAAMEEMKGDISFGCYEIVARDKANPAGELVLMDIAARNEDRALAIGSTCSLYVLGALAEEAAAGRVAWGEEVAIEDRLRSLPSGKMQLMPAGAKASIETFARNMIGLSDNTATDHLIARLGRGRIESYTNAMNDNVVKNTPFLTTREAFVLKLSKDKAGADAFIEAGDAEQSAMLDEGGALHGLSPDLEAAAEWGEPRLIESVEWFASAKQLATAFMRLRQLEQHPGNGPLGDIMRPKAGLTLDPATWKSVAYKGGSEPGVINMTWLLERNDGHWYVFSIGQNDRGGAIDQEQFSRMCQRGLEILAKDGVGPIPAAPAPAPARDPFMDTGDEPGPPVDDGT